MDAGAIRIHALSDRAVDDAVSCGPYRLVFRMLRADSHHLDGMPWRMHARRALHISASHQVARFSSRKYDPCSLPLRALRYGNRPHGHIVSDEDTACHSKTPSISRLKRSAPSKDKSLRLIRDTLRNADGGILHPEGRLKELDDTPDTHHYENRNNAPQHDLQTLALGFTRCENIPDKTPEKDDERNGNKKTNDVVGEFADKCQDTIEVLGSSTCKEREKESSCCKGRISYIFPHISGLSIYSKVSQWYR